MLHHNEEPKCPNCEEKLFNTHPVLVEWYRRVKAKYPSVHIAWSFRGQADQEEAVKEGKSELHYPMSAHNKTDDKGIPCARALDLFQIDDDGVARFSPMFYAKIADDCEQSHEPIKWGGHWKNLGDRDHFQLSG